MPSQRHRTPQLSTPCSTQHVASRLIVIDVAIMHIAYRQTSTTKLIAADRKDEISQPRVNRSRPRKTQLTQPSQHRNEIDEIDRSRPKSSIAKTAKTVAEDAAHAKTVHNAYRSTQY
jgi:hypothetical protein